VLIGAGSHVAEHITHSDQIFTGDSGETRAIDDNVLIIEPAARHHAIQEWVRPALHDKISTCVAF
jgi:hypothetical protein